MNNCIKEISITFIGAGNLATNLAKALFKQGFHIAQVYSRTENAASTLAQQINAEWTVDLHLLTNDSQLYIVALKDDALMSLLPQIIKEKQKALFVHTAGSIPMDIWKGKTLNYGVFYPMQTFSKQHEVDFKEVSFFIEANTLENTQTLKSIAYSLSPKVYEADSKQRKLLHLAAVFACNFTNHMYTLADELLKKEGLPFDVLLPLIDETARKVRELSPKDAQTGPAVRYDEYVINNHINMLKGIPNLQRIYKLLTQDIHEHHQL